MALAETNEDIMFLSQFDGFCTGLIVCPELIPPSQWLKTVWGGPGELQFESLEAFQAALDLIMGHYNRVVRMLRIISYYVLDRPASEAVRQKRLLEVRSVRKATAASDIVLWKGGDRMRRWAILTGCGVQSCALPGLTFGAGLWFPSAQRVHAKAVAARALQKWDKS